MHSLYTCLLAVHALCYNISLIPRSFYSGNAECIKRISDVIHPALQNLERSGGGGGWDEMSSSLYTQYVHCTMSGFHPAMKVWGGSVTNE